MGAGSSQHKGTDCEPGEKGLSPDKELALTSKALTFCMFGQKHTWKRNKREGSRSSTYIGHSTKQLVSLDTVEIGKEHSGI